MKLSIIIVSYNTKDILDKCLQSVYDAKWTSTFEVIVVDNNSNDGSQDMIRDKYPEVHLIANEKNRLFAIANNQGAKIAKGEYLLLLNSDTLVWDDNLQKMVNYFDRESKDVICIGPRVLNKDKTLQSCGRPNDSYRERFVMSLKLYEIFPAKLLEQFFRLPGIPRDTKEVRPVGWVAGCAMMLRKKLYDQVGGLNERIEFYGEEPEFGYRTSRLGFKTLYYPHAEIIHLGGASTEREREREREKERKKERRRCRKLSSVCKTHRRNMWLSKRY